MPLFDYTGQLPSGATFQGALEATGTEEAEATLARLGVRVTTLRPAQRTAYVAPLSLDEFTFFNEQLAAMTQSRLPLDAGLRQLAADVGSRKLKRLLLDLAGDLAAGTPLEDALQRQQRRFPPQYPAVVEAGLRTGDVAGTLYGLTTHLRLKSHMRRTLLELALYPLFVLVLTFLITAFIMRAVVPALASVVFDLAAEMGPRASSVQQTGALVFWLANVWPTVEIIFGALLVLLIVGLVLVCLPGSHRVREFLLRRVPGFAQVYWSSVVARFAHTSALAAFSGTPLPELIAASGAASGSPSLAKATQRVADRLVRGESLVVAAADERDVPALWTCAVTVAAPRGDLPAALTELARAYELRAQHWVSTIRALLGPLLFLIVAAGVGGVVVSLLAGVNLLLRTIMGII